MSERALIRDTQQRTEIVTTIADRSDRAEDFFSGGFLQQIATRADSDDAFHVLTVIEHAQHQNADVRMATTQLSRQINATHASHANVQQHHIGSLAGHYLQSFIATTGLACAFHFIEGGRWRRRTCCHQGGVVGLGAAEN